jgi:cellulose biosynthesis protein BcsQ
MIPSAVMISNGKGGVLKTSLAANLSGLAALVPPTSGMLSA